jgi:hypothetical protein
MAPLVWRSPLTLPRVASPIATRGSATHGLHEGRGDDRALRSHPAGSAGNTLAGVTHPDGAILVLGSAATTFAGSLWQVWSGLRAGDANATTPPQPAIAARATDGLIATMTYCQAAGPGLLG